MNRSADFLPETLVQTSQDLEKHRRGKAHAAPPQSPSFCVAISREVGAGATSVAREIGRRLGWNVYDHELLEQMAREMNVRVGLIESVDERHVPWLQESLESFATKRTVSESSYVAHLVETLFALATRGKCVFVGRGAAKILPASTTLRVRLMAPLDYRVGVMSRQLGVARDEAARHIEQTDRERERFVKDHFHCDSTDPQGYDLIINTARFTIEESAAMIERAMHHVEAHWAKDHPGAPAR